MLSWSDSANDDKSSCRGIYSVMSTLLDTPMPDSEDVHMLPDNVRCVSIALTHQDGPLSSIWVTSNIFLGRELPSKGALLSLLPRSSNVWAAKAVDNFETTPLYACSLPNARYINDCIAIAYMI